MAMTSEVPRSAGAVRRSRRRVSLAILVVVPLGMILRQLPGEFGNLAAGACFPILFGAIFWLISPRLSSLACATLAFGLAAGIETAQLTPIPALLTNVFPPAYWLVGTTFAAIDLLGYALGALALAALGPVLAAQMPAEGPGRCPATPNGRGQ